MTVCTEEVHAVATPTGECFCGLYRYVDGRIEQTHPDRPDVYGYTELIDTYDDLPMFAFMEDE